jgi:hypothetical protein
MASWRDAGWEEAQPERGVTSNTQIGRSAISYSRQSLTSLRESNWARARIVVEKCAYRNLTLLLTRYDTKEQFSLLWDESRLLETSHSAPFAGTATKGRYCARENMRSD